MEPWITDAGNITMSRDTKNYLLTNSQIETFLKVGLHEKNFFLIGAKGLGKTLFLKYKRYLYQNSNISSSYKFHPSGEELCENLILDYSNISKEELLKFQEQMLWERMWLFCLSIVVCKTAGIAIPESVQQYCPSNIRVSTVLSRLLKERRTISDILNMHNETMLNCLHSVDSGVAIFIDNLDQELENVLRGPHYSDFHFDNDYPAVKVWINAQFGLMSTIYKMNRANPHVKIFTSIRREAYENIPNSLKSNYESYSTLLEYSKAEVKSIFNKNIELMSEHDYVEKRKDNTLIKKFLGFDMMPHSFAKKDGAKISEEAFNFIYRHTFGRPREVVLIGKEIGKFIKNNPDYRVDAEKIEKIRKLVNAISNNLFYQYQTEIIPNFDLSSFDYFLNSIKKNIIPKEILQEIDLETVRLYYNLGLIGFTSELNYENKSLIQKFLPPARYNYKHLSVLPNSDYFVTHPSMDEDLRKKYNGKFYSKENIIGDEYPFYYPSTSDVKNFVVQFGAGKLAMGFVLPLLNSLQGSVAIVQRPDSILWNNIFDKVGNKSFEVFKNEKKSFSLKIYNAYYISDEEKIRVAIKYWKEGNNILLLTNNVNVISKFIDQCQFITTSTRADGLKNISDILSSIEIDEAKAVLPFENDRIAVRQFRETLLGSSFFVNYVTADKICSDISFKRNALTITCEEYEHAWISSNDFGIINFFGGSKIVTTRESEVEETFDNDRKTYMLNGIHTILAIYADSKFLAHAKTKALKSAPIIHLLCEIQEISESLKVFCEFQAIRLILENSVGNLSAVIKNGDLKPLFKELKNYGIQTVKRFASLPDKSERILGNIDGLQSKFEKHILPLIRLATSKDTEIQIRQLKLMTSQEFSNTKNKLLELEEKLILILSRNTTRIKKR